MPFSGRAIRRPAALLLGFGFLLLLAVGGTSLVLVQQTRGFANAASEMQTARVALGTALAVLQDAETGQRGFLLTGDRRYLQPFTDATRRLPEVLKQLGPLLARIPDGEEEAAALAQFGQAKLAELGETVALEEQNRHDAAITLVETDRGQLLMEQARGLIGRMLTEVDARRAADRAGLFGRSRQLLGATWVGLGLILAVSAAAIWMVVRNIRALDEAGREVEAANASLEARVQERTADLAAANDEIQRFAYIVSHDLRAPLVNVMGFTAELDAALVTVRGLLGAVRDKLPELATEEVRLAVEEDLPEAVGFIRTSTARMDRLINAILKLSREGRRTLTPEWVGMEELFRTVVTSVQHQLDEASATVTIPTPMPDLVSDRLALEQVFGNLLDNAVKYLDRGRPGVVTVRGRLDGTQIRYEVADNGRGIAEKDRERVFELFRRAGVQDRPGEGIGLAHVRALVRRLGGTIEFTSEPGRGTTFAVSLPRTLNAATLETAA